jgi:carboxymethylenebutenolidase
MAIAPMSRTVGTESIVDEMIVKFTHDRVIDYLLPGIPPTGRQVEIAAVVVAQFRDGKLASEHIYWDQVSVLGLITSVSRLARCAARPAR